MAAAVDSESISDFRVYDDASSVRHAGVLAHYTEMRKNQCLSFSRSQKAKWLSSWGSRVGGRMTVGEALHKCDSFVDRSDPDTALPNSIHMLQAAEGARAAGKPDWFVLCALVHDVGKLMYLWGTVEDGQGGKAHEAQWALGGDTWVVGVAIPDCAVHAQLNGLSPDASDAAINGSPTGLYAPGVGMMNVEYSWGHDEYAYLWALHNKVDIPLEGLAMLRLHSCYPWHTGGAYAELQGEGDGALKAAVQDFNRFDLYTKCQTPPDRELLWPYYQEIIDRLCPGLLDW